jgi:hypothetical protein
MAGLAAASGHRQEGFERNVWVALEPKDTDYAFVWVTRNRSLNGDTREKLALLEVGFNEGRDRFGCTIVFRQPKRS